MPFNEDPLCVKFISLGCAKNLVDSEKMLGLIGLAGFALVSPGEQADITVINTCGFIQSARDESFEHIQNAIDEKKTGQTKYILIAGCLAQSWKSKLLDKFPQVDAIIGLNERDHVADIIRSHFVKTSHSGPIHVSDRPFNLVSNDRERLRLTDPSWAYLRISEGCDRHCTFCVIPDIRGPFRSKPLNAILAEAREMIDDGVVELNLIGQETSSYGVDIGLQNGLSDLLYALNDLPGLQWVRIFYMHPATVTSNLIDTIQNCPKVNPYIDIPLQHISDRILKLMNRNIDKSQTIELLNTFRLKIPDITIRTTMLIGFPTESDDEFNELLAFIKEFQFDALGAFQYSNEPGSPAYRITPALPTDIIESRYHTLMAAQQEIAFSKAQDKIGQHLECLIIDQIDRRQAKKLGLPGKTHWYYGRHKGQGPEVDPITYIAAPGQAQWMPGQIISVHITSSLGYDLIAKPA